MVEIVLMGKENKLNLQIKKTKKPIRTTIPTSGVTSEIGFYAATTLNYCKRLNRFCMCASGKGFVNITEQMFSNRILVV